MPYSSNSPVLPCQVPRQCAGSDCVHSAVLHRNHCTQLCQLVLGGRSIPVHQAETGENRTLLGRTLCPPVIHISPNMAGWLPSMRQWSWTGFVLFVFACWSEPPFLVFYRQTRSSRRTGLCQSSLATQTFTPSSSAQLTSLWMGKCPVGPEFCKPHGWDVLFWLG